MTTSFNDLFDKILEDGHVDVAITGPDAETLRTSLVRRWNKYKQQYESLGFLSEERKNQSMGSSPIQIADGIIGTRYQLKMKRGRVNYMILTPDKTE